MNQLYYSALFENENIENDIKTQLEDNKKEIIPVLALYKDKEWSIEVIEKLIESIESEEDNFELLDELIYYLTYFENGYKYLEQLNDKVTNMKLKLEIITSITENNREAGLEYMKEFVTSDDIGKISIGIYLIKDFRAKELIKELKSVMNRPMLDDIKYQVLFTLGTLEDKSILPTLLKGALNKNDLQLNYLDSLKYYDDDLVKNSLKKVASRKFGDKIIKLRTAQLLYPFDNEYSNSIFSKFIKSKKLDIQGYVMAILTELKNNSFVPQMNEIFNSENHFHKANSILYFRRIKYISKLKEVRKFYNHPKFDLRDEASKFVATLETNNDNLISFYNDLENENEKFTFLKTIIDNKLRLSNEK